MASGPPVNGRGHLGSSSLVTGLLFECEHSYALNILNSLVIGS